MIKRCFFCNKMLFNPKRKTVIKASTADGELTMHACKRCADQLDQLAQERAYESI